MSVSLSIQLSVAGAPIVFVALAFAVPLSFVLKQAYGAFDKLLRIRSLWFSLNLLQYKIKLV